MAPNSPDTEYEVYVEGRRIARSEPCFIIAEAGTSHGGRIDHARSLIDAAQQAGADCVKFQAVFADEIVHPLAGEIELPGGCTPIYDSFKRVEAEESFYRAARKHCIDHGIAFLCSPFGVRSARLLEQLGVGWIKIASPEINHFPLLDLIRRSGLGAIVSTGVSRLADIENAMSRLGEQVALLHCVTAYPAPADEYNLSLLEHMEALFGVPVGVSDHTRETDLVPVLSVLAGASIIEKHLTLSNDGGGLDDPVALTPAAFSEMVARVREAGIDRNRAERALCSTYGDDRISAVMGDGKKRLARVEERFYRTTNRSILTVSNIRRSEPFTETNIALLRSETNIDPGLSPEHLDEILKRVAARDIDNGCGISWTDVGPRSR